MNKLIPAVLLLLSLAACNGSDDETKTETRNVNPGDVITVNFATSTPSSVQAGDDVLLELGLTSTNPIATVRVNLTSVGGSATADLFDDGTNGDATAGDNTWSLLYTLSSTGLSLGSQIFAYTVTDDESFTHNGAFTLNITNAAPEFSVTGSTLDNADGASGSVFGPGETMEFRIDVQDPDGSTAAMTVTADLSGAFGGTTAEPLTYNSTSGLWELDYVGPRTLIPTDGTGNVLITATDTNSGTTSELFSLDAQNWVGLAGSASGDGISTSLGWTLGAACATDSAGRIYVAYSSRVNTPSGWQYAVYVKRYDPATNTWSGLNGSDSGFGLCLNTQSRLISSGYVRDMAYYAETNQTNNKEAIYVVFDGNPDPDPSENHWDSFLFRWNITDNQWEALGTGTDASDYVTDTPTVGVMDVGGFTQFGNRAQEASLSFDSATDDVYVAWHGQIDSSGSNKYAVFVSRFNRTTSLWEDFSGATPADGISDDHADNYKFPIVRHHGGKLYVIYHNGTTSGDILIQEGDIATGNWTAATTIHDSSTLPAAGYPALVIDSAGNLYAGWKITQSAPTDQEVHVLTATSANWGTASNWVAPDGVSSKISIPDNTKTTVIYLQLACDANDNVYACWNQVHPGSTDTSKRGVFLAVFNGNSWASLRGSLSDDGLSDYGPEDHWLPALAIDHQGRPVVAYDTFWGTGSGNDRRKIYVKTLR